MSRAWVVAITLACAAPLAAAQEYVLSFAGPKRFIRVDGFRLPADLRAVTVELRFRSLGQTRKRVPLAACWSSAKDAEDAGTFELALLHNGKWEFSVRDADGRVESVLSARIKRDDAWHHVAGRWDGAVLSIFIDGVESARKELPEFGALSPSRLPLVIGAVPSGKRRAPEFLGVLSDVAIWSAARAPEEIGKRIDARAPHLRSYLTLRTAVPTAEVANALRSGPAGVLSASLYRSGWRSERVDLVHHAFDGSIAWNERRVLINDEERVGVMWRESEGPAIRVEWLNPETGAHQSARMDCANDDRFVAGAADAKGNLYYLLAQALPFGRPPDQTLRVTIHKASPAGKPLLHQQLDTLPEALNVWYYAPADLGSMRVSGGTVGVIFPHRMYKGGDGLRHQRAIALTFSTKTLALQRNLGQTSGHSKGSILSVGSKGRFLGLDLGDNYPRGLHLHRFDSGGRVSRVVFTYKTRHGTGSFRGSPRYDEISDDKTTFYKWSNDNWTYTRLGTVAEGRKCYYVVFATARSLDGKVLENSRAFSNCTDPWDVGLLRIRKDFQKSRGGTSVSDDILAARPKEIVSETGGYFDFGGRWNNQRVTGVQWLTNYGQGEYAVGPQASVLDDGGLLVLWEKLVGKELQLLAMRFDAKGAVVRAPTAIQKRLRLNPDDRVVRIGDRVYFLAGDTSENRRVRLYSYRDAD